MSNWLNVTSAGTTYYPTGNLATKEASATDTLSASPANTAAVSRIKRIVVNNAYVAGTVTGSVEIRASAAGEAVLLAIKMPAAAAVGLQTRSIALDFTVQGGFGVHLVAASGGAPAYDFTVEYEMTQRWS